MGKWPNRIRELRERAGMSSAELGTASGMSGSQIRRLELGQRRLKMEEMRAIATALKTGAASLYPTIALAEIDKDEAAPVEGDGSAAVASLAMRGLRVYRVTEHGKSLVRIGILPGAQLVVDENAERIAQPKMGDIVLVRIGGSDDENGGGQHPLVWRQFMPPDLLLTVPEGSSMVIRLDDADLKPKIVGVVDKT